MADTAMQRDDAWRLAKNGPYGGLRGLHFLADTPVRFDDAGVMLTFSDHGHEYCVESQRQMTVPAGDQLVCWESTTCMYVLAGTEEQYPHESEVFDWCQ